MFCQLEVLRHCLPASIRQTLNQLPKSLDETYVRVLCQIPEANRAHAHRMLQCLAVAVRPLRVEELAELLAFEFDESQGGMPKYRAAWRLDDQTQAVLSTCSSLVTIVDQDWQGPIVQFSHFSVKEFLMSNRLTSPLGDFSGYHIHPGPAHTILTQACLGFLLHLEDHIDQSILHAFPLAYYAAGCWVEHAQFDDVASRVKDGMETLFDSDKPYFWAWIRICDIDQSWSQNYRCPLYYAALCGFYDLVKHLIIKHPQCINAISGRYSFPLLAALSEGHVEIAELLLEHGANVNVRETCGKTVLLVAISRCQYHLVDILKFLLKYGADVNARGDALRSSLHLAVYEGKFEVAQVLLENNADVNSRDDDGKTPLHTYTERLNTDEGDVLEHTLLLLKHGAEVNGRDKNDEAPLHSTIKLAQFHLARILLEHGADVNVKNNDGMTPLHMLLSGRDALNLSLSLLEHGADANAQNNDGMTPLHILSENRIRDEGDVLNLALVLLKHGAEVNRRSKNDYAPLHLAIFQDKFNLARFLLEHGADVNVKNNDGMTPLHLLPWVLHDGDVLKFALLLLKHGAEVNRRDIRGDGPLHSAMEPAPFDLARILLEHGADANAENDDGMTPLHVLSWGPYFSDVPKLALLLKHGAEVNRRNKHDDAPLHLAIRWAKVEVTGILLQHGADANAENNIGMTPLHTLSACHHDEGDVLELVWLLLKHGAEVNKRDKNGEAPLHLAIRQAEDKLAEILLENGADSHAQNNDGMTPLHILSERQIRNEGDVLNLALLLLKHGTEVSGRDEDDGPLLHLAIQLGRFKLAGSDRSETPLCQEILEGEYFYNNRVDNPQYLTRA